MSRSTILIIEDEAVNIEILVEMLRSKYELKIAYDGAMGIKIAKKILPDIILLDIEMPKMDGFDVAWELKNNDETKDIPIIFLTSKTDKEVIIAALSSGAVDYVIKPYFKEELEARIANHLKARLLKKVKISKNISLEGIDIKKIRAFLGIEEEVIFKMLLNFSKTYSDIKNDIKESTLSYDEFSSYMRKLKGVSANLQINTIHSLSSYLEANFMASDKNDKINELIFKTQKIVEMIQTSIAPLIVENKIIEDNKELLKLINSIIYDIDNFNFIKEDRVHDIYNSLINRVEISLLKEMFKNFENNDYDDLENTLKKIKRVLNE